MNLLFFVYGLQPVRKGKRTWGRYPLHGLKTPSPILDGKGRFHCLRCGKSEDRTNSDSLEFVYDEALQDHIRYCDDALAGAIRFWKYVKDRFSPGMLNGNFIHLYAKACRLLPELEYLDEQFTEGDNAIKGEIMNDYQEEFTDWHSRYVPDRAAWDAHPDDDI